MKLPAHVLLYALLAFAALALASPCQAQQTSRQQNSTPQQALDKRQDAFQADKAKGVHASYQWELSGPNGGEWWLSVNDGTYKMGRGKIDNPKAEGFSHTTFDYLFYIDNEHNPMILNLLAESKAHCRVGRYREDHEPFFELMFNNSGTTKGLIDSMYKYTRQLR